MSQHKEIPEIMGKINARYGMFSPQPMSLCVDPNLSMPSKAEGPNVLLLDEPTNYISLDVLEAFEAAILGFPGPVIAVSHDRWFMQRFGGEVWELVDGTVVRR